MLIARCVLFFSLLLIIIVVMFMNMVLHISQAAQIQVMFLLLSFTPFLDLTQRNGVITIDVVDAIIEDREKVVAHRLGQESFLEPGAIRV